MKKFILIILVLILGNPEGKLVKPYEEKTDKTLVEREINIWQSIGEFKITYYWPGEDKYGTATSTGATATEGRTVAVDPNIIPYGTEVLIDGHIYVAEDTGSALKGNKIIDIFVNEPKQEMYYANIYIRKEK